MSQSGGVGVALAGQLSRLGVGISSFASVGSKLDVSGNDMLMWWEHDDVTRLAVLYLESFGNPRKFARTARRVGATLPARLAATRQDRRPAALLRDLVDAEPAQSEDEAVKAAGAMEPIVTGGTEIKTGVTHDRVFGPLVVFGPGDHAARLTPPTDTDADALIRSIDAAPRLLGQRGVPATDLETLRELLLRVSRGLRNGRADQAGALPATGPFSSFFVGCVYW